MSEYLYYSVAKETNDFEEWIQNMRQPGTWGGATVALFVCWIYNVNICIVTNSTRGFITNDLGNVNWKGRPYDTSYPTVFLYHHRYKAPFIPSSTCDHFAYMFLCEYDSSLEPEKM